MLPRKNLISSGDMRSIYCMHEKRALDSYFHGWEMHRISFDYKTYSLLSPLADCTYNPFYWLFYSASRAYPMFGHFPFICRSECVTYQSLLKLFSHFHAFKGFGTNMKICFDFKIKVELKNHLRSWEKFHSPEIRHPSRKMKPRKKLSSLTLFNI